jgi:hypothetical protein
MRQRGRIVLAVVLTAGGLLSAGCPPPVPPGVAYVSVSPPVPVPEVLVTAPGPDHVWVRGYHRWDGGAYVWVPGSWQRPPRAHAVWVSGRWRHTSRGWYWVEGRWK